MFTGLIKNTSQVLQKEKRSGGYHFLISKPLDWNDLQIGESIAVQGICLTLEEYTVSEMKFFVGLETLGKTNFLYLKQNQAINLERSLTLNDRLGGHLVSGHVDGTALIVAAEPEGECLKLTLRLNSDLLKWVVTKGSITVEGVSLTVNEVKEDEINLFLIPETLKVTTLKNLKVGDFVNIECDQVTKIITEKMKAIYEHNSRTH